MMILRLPWPQDVAVRPRKMTVIAMTTFERMNSRIRPNCISHLKTQNCQNPKFLSSRGAPVTRDPYIRSAASGSRGPSVADKLRSSHPPLSMTKLSSRQSPNQQLKEPPRIHIHRDLC